MKKLFLSLAVFGFLFAACNRDDNGNGYENGETRRLPSKKTSVWLNDGVPNYWHYSFEYDNQNRLVKRIAWGQGWSDTLEFLYQDGNSPVKILSRAIDNGEAFQSQREILYVDSLVIINWNDGDWSGSDTLVVNSNMQIVNWPREWGRFEYNSNGNISRSIPLDWYSIEISYSNAKSIFRYANIPGWLMVWVFGVEFPEIGYMPSEFRRNNQVTATFMYTLDGNWVRTRTSIYPGEAEQTSTFEYINAR